MNKKSKEQNHDILGHLSNEEVIPRILEGMDQGEFVLYYHPVVSSETEKIEIAEVLVRWNHPELGMLKSTSFMPRIMESELIVPFGYHVLHLLNKDIGVLKQHCGYALKFGVSITRRQLIEHGFAHYVLNIFSMYNNDPRDIIIEIAEYEALDNDQTLESVIYDLKSHGVEFALDNFGIDYASLLYLNQLPISILKIDESFLPDQALFYSKKIGSLFESIVHLCKCSGITTVAEGIEDESHAALIRQFGVDMMQGYHYYKPMDLDKLLDVFNHLSFL